MGHFDQRSTLPFKNIDEGTGSTPMDVLPLSLLRHPSAMSIHRLPDHRRYIMLALTKKLMEREVSGMDGSKSNPIVIRDDKDVRSHCNQQEHQPEDCDTPKSTLQHCPICAWTKQTLCTHINASPAWLKELKENFEQRHQ